MKDGNIKDFFEGKLLAREEILKLLRDKSNTHEYKSVDRRIIDDFSDWEKVKDFKTKVKIRRKKKHNVYFEDAVWCLFAKLGFQTLNKDSTLSIPYGEPNNQGIYDKAKSQQIDVFAKDEECVLFIECKSSDTPDHQKSFKKDIESIISYRTGLINTVKHYYDKNFKFLFIFATRNYKVSPEDKKRLKDYHIYHLDDETFKYYNELVNHMGTSAHYQVLSILFKDLKIPNLSSKIPAIRGKMGNKQYYSFSIEPATLLKLSCILHRHESIKKEQLLPSYQRLVKKTRLTSIRKFVNEGGYFPNSIIINIETDKGESSLFTGATTKHTGTSALLGHLQLPNKYGSIYIIDGQHRLYGYASSKFENTNSIPVVAFINLPKAEQLKLFMDINENQKAVSKNLRMTLNRDLFSDSKDINERRKAWLSDIALSLADDDKSPLYNKILANDVDTEKSLSKCITLDSITKPIGDGIILPKYSKDGCIRKDGFYKHSDEQVLLQTAKELCKQYLRIYAKSLPDEWTNGEDNEGIIATNRGIIAILRILSDIIIHLKEKCNISLDTPKKMEAFVDSIEEYTRPVISFIKNLNYSSRKELKLMATGGGGHHYFWRKLQEIVRESYPEFNPEGLDDHLMNNTKKFNQDAQLLIEEIDSKLRNLVKIHLEEYLKCKWFESSLESLNKLLQRVQILAVINQDKNALNDPWSYTTLSDIKEIISSFWNSKFKKIIKSPLLESSKKKDNLAWIDTIISVKDNLNKSKSIPKIDFESLQKIKVWISDIEN